MLQAGCHSVRSPFYIFKNDIHDLEHGLGSGELCHESAAFGSEDNLQYLFRPLGYIVSQLQTSGIVSLRAVRELLAGCFRLNGGSQAKRSAGVLKEEEISINTLEEGSYDFHNTNPYALLNGVMSISLDIDQGLIASITDIAPQGFMDEFISTLSSKRVIYSYDERDDYTDLPYCIFMAEYDIDGALIDDGSSALEEFNTTLEESGRGIKALEGEGEDDEEIIKNSSSPLKEYVIVIRLGVSDIVEVDEQRFIVSVHTSMNCYNPSTMALISSETSVSSVGYGSSYEAAASDAFKRAGRILADVLMIDL